MPFFSSSSSGPYTLDNTTCSTPANTYSVPTPDKSNAMGWTGWPAVKGTDLQHFCFLIQLWQAVRERGYIACDKYYGRMTDSNIGRGCHPSSSSCTPLDAGGIVESVSLDGDEYVITDGSAWWLTSCGLRLSNYQCEPADPCIPMNYDAIFQTKGYEDWTGVVRANVAGQDDETSFRVPAVTIDNLVTAGYLASPSALVGSTIHFIKTGGLWWADVANPDLGRWPHFPNEWELEKGEGTGSVGGTFTDSGTEIDHLTNPRREWVPNQFAGKELLVYGAGKLYRLPIYCNTDRTLYLSAALCTSSSSNGGLSSSSSSGLPISGSYLIVEPAAKGMPQRYPWMPFAWYGGAPAADIKTHHPDDSFSTYPTFPASNVVWQELDCTAGPESCYCRDYNHPRTAETEFAIPFGALDLEMWSELDNECDCDTPYSPLLLKTVRSIQNAIVGMAGSFVEAREWDNFAGRHIPNLTVARMFELDGTNSIRTTITSVAGVCGLISSSSGNPGAYVSGIATLAAGFATVPEVMPQVTYFAVYDSNGELKASGAGSLSQSSGGSSSSGAGITFSGDGITSEHCGMDIVISLGYSRFYPREFRYMFGKTCFVPDLCPNPPGDPVAKIPPAPCCYCCDCDLEEGEEPPPCCHDCMGVGHWYNRPNPSLGYLEPNYDGQLYDGVPFVANEYARYIGDNWHDIFDGREVPTGDEEDPQTVWYDHFYRGTHPPLIEEQLLAQKSGAASDGGLGFLTDITQNWWDNKWHGNDTMHIETGTATGGSTTTLIDTTKDYNAPTDGDYANCYWNPERFVGWNGTSAFPDFILEVQLVTDGPWVKRPIVSSNAATQTLTVSPAFPSSTSGKVYRIREPYSGELNRWRGRRLRIFPAVCSTSSSSSSAGLQLSSSSSTAANVYYEVEIKYSDDTTLWWDTSVSGQNVTATACYRYQILEPEYGGVWKFTTTPPTSSSTSTPSEVTSWKIADGKWWVKPTGADAVRLGVKEDPQPFHSKQEENLPTIVRRYGPWTKGDYISMESLTECYKAINRLRWTKGNYVWEARGLGCNANEVNMSDLEGHSFGEQASIFGVITSGSSDECEFDDAYGYPSIADVWNTPFDDECNLEEIEFGPCDWTSGSNPYSGYSGAPFVDFVVGTEATPLQAHGGPYGEHNHIFMGANASGGFQFARSTGICTLLAHSVDFYAYGQVNSSDTPEGYLTNDPTGYCPDMDGAFGPGAPGDWGCYPNIVELKFNDFGTGVKYHKWGKWYAFPEARETERATDTQLGSIMIDPVFSSLPTMGSIGTSTIMQGFYVGDTQAIYKWDGENGLRFID